MPNTVSVKTLPDRLNGLRADPWQDLPKVEQVLPSSTGRSRQPKR
jgi:hypothetical protein